MKEDKKDNYEPIDTRWQEDKIYVLGEVNDKNSNRESNK